MPRLRSAGILMYRRTGAVEVLLAHPGGPFWRGKDLGAWSIPKGVYDATEAPEAAAVREFEEELGVRPVGSLLPLGEAVQAGGKVVTGFALEGDLDCSQIRSNEFEIEWPPKSGRRASFPEVDRAEWFALDIARDKIVRGQAVFLDRLAAALAPDPR